MMRVSNLKRLYSDKVVFSDVNYDFPEHGVVFLTGPSGSGKTTFLRILAGLESPSEGTVEGFANNVSFCFQEHRLFPNLTALKNLTEVSFSHATEQEKEVARALLIELGFSESDLSKYPSELSGGMKQRLAFARSVLYNKPVLILDEPLKEVDPKIAETIRKIILREAEKRLVLLVSHDRSDAEIFSDRTIVFGKIESSDQPFNIH